MFLLATVPTTLALVPASPAAQEQPPRIEFDMTVLSGRNPFLTTDDRAMTSAAEVSARGEAALPVDARTTIDLDGKLAYRRYSRRYGSFVTGHARGALDYRGSERIALRTEASFERQLPLEGSNSTIDAAIDPISLQDRIELKQDIRWRPDPYLTITGEAAWSRLAPRGSMLLIRTDATSFGLSVERRISPSSWVGLSGMATFSKSANRSEADSGIVMLKMGTRLARNLSTQVEAGLSRIERREPARPNDNGPAQLTATMSLCYDPRRLRMCLSGRISPSVTSFGGIQREKVLTATFDFQTGERGMLRASGEYRSVPSPIFGSDAKITRLSTTYEHRLDSRFRLHVGADYDRRTGMSSQTQSSWTIRAGVTIRIPSR
ncbi:hypothetical protein A8V01_20820 [Novosphingobium guangzhouense]|uniref:Gellan polysaccharide biosynthesis protein GelF n=1 Tax=Novosphingobium guangzhouense TaxID=1850347 RepID=A0A2K2FZY4_9SPHN|nr:hypothetical protein A8V01_20820 [Novosphingobium guangzhouense]